MFFSPKDKPESFIVYSLVLVFGMETSFESAKLRSIDFFGQDATKKHSWLDYDSPVE